MHPEPEKRQRKKQAVKSGCARAHFAHAHEQRSETNPGYAQEKREDSQSPLCFRLHALVPGGLACEWLGMRLNPKLLLHDFVKIGRAIQGSRGEIGPNDELRHRSIVDVN